MTRAAKKTPKKSARSPLTKAEPKTTPPRVATQEELARRPGVIDRLVKT